MRASVTSIGLLVLVTPGLAAAADATSAYASDAERAEERDFSIAAQPVSQALREYAQQSGDQVVFYSEVGKASTRRLCWVSSRARTRCSDCCSIRD